MVIFRYTFNEKRDWRMRFHHGSAICDLNEINGLDIQQDEVLNNFYRYYKFPDNIWSRRNSSGSWAGAIVELDKRKSLAQWIYRLRILARRSKSKICFQNLSVKIFKFVASSLPGVTPSNNWAKEMCSTPDECKGCLV